MHHFGGKPLPSLHCLALSSRNVAACARRPPGASCLQSPAGPGPPAAVGTSKTQHTGLLSAGRGFLGWQLGDRRYPESEINSAIRILSQFTKPFVSVTSSPGRAGSLLPALRPADNFLLQCWLFQADPERRCLVVNCH